MDRYRDGDSGDHIITDATLASEEWWNSYQNAVNADPEMTLHSRDAFDGNFVVDISEEHFLVDMQGGQVQDVRTPGLDDAWSFGVVGNREAWEQFVEEVPPPHHNELFASFYRTAVKGEAGYFDLIGNHEKIFQNFRSFQRAIGLMRTTTTADNPELRDRTDPQNPILRPSQGNISPSNSMVSTTVYTTRRRAPRKAFHCSVSTPPGVITSSGVTFSTTRRSPTSTE